MLDIGLEGGVVDVADKGAGLDQLFRALDAFGAGGEHLFLPRGDLAHGDHARRLRRVAAIGDVRDVEIDQVAGPHHVAVGLAAMGAVLVDADLVAVAGLAAARELGKGEGGVDLGVGHARPRHVIGGLGADEISCAAARNISISRGERIFCMRSMMRLSATNLAFGIKASR